MSDVLLLVVRGGALLTLTARSTGAVLTLPRRAVPAEASPQDIASELAVEHGIIAREVDFVDSISVKRPGREAEVDVYVAFDWQGEPAPAPGGSVYWLSAATPEAYTTHCKVHGLGEDPTAMTALMSFTNQI